MATHKRPNVLVVGSGGVGTIAALSLTLNDKADVTLVVRSDYEKIIRDGYTINSVTYGTFNNWRPYHVSKSVATAQDSHGPFDFVVLTTKNIPDGTSTCEDIIRPAVTENTTILLMQNGIGIDEPMRAAFPKNVLLLGISLIASTYFNCVVSNPYKDQLTLSPFTSKGYDHQRAMEKVHQFEDLYRNADPEKNDVKVEECAKRSRWEKLVYNATLNTICALTGSDVNRCQINGANKTLFKPAMKEVLAIAASENVYIDELLCSKFLQAGNGLFYAPSMLVDFRKKQLCELEVIIGNPLKYAEKNGVAAPILTTVYHLLKIRQFGLKEEKGMITINPEDYRGLSSDEYPERFQTLTKSQST